MNEEIDRLRHSATAALLERRDVIIVASVSCIYGLGDPDDYKNLMIFLRVGNEIDRNLFLKKLVEIQYARNDLSCERGTFRVRGDVVEVFPVSSGEAAIRIEFFGDEIERICEINTLTGEILAYRSFTNDFSRVPLCHNRRKDEACPCYHKARIGREGRRIKISG